MWASTKKQLDAPLKRWNAVETLEISLFRALSKNTHKKNLQNEENPLVTSCFRTGKGQFF